MPATSVRQPGARAKRLARSAAAAGSSSSEVAKARCAATERMPLQHPSGLSSAAHERRACPSLSGSARAQRAWFPLGARCFRRPPAGVQALGPGPAFGAHPPARRFPSRLAPPRLRRTPNARRCCRHSPKQSAEQAGRRADLLAARTPGPGLSKAGSNSLPEHAVSMRSRPTFVNPPLRPMRCCSHKPGHLLPARSLYMR